ncbi:MAG: hypothetical protein ACLTSX_00880 [Collinsella sp.]
MGLQAALAQVDAALENALEDNNDSTARIVHFVNRNDIADYLATAPITTQTVFGTTYIKDFLGVTDIFVTNKVPKGTIYATPVENIHIYGADFGALAQAGLSYTVQDGGLIGVHHVANYARTSAETHALSGVSMLPRLLASSSRAPSRPQPQPRPLAPRPLIKGALQWRHTLSSTITPPATTRTPTTRSASPCCSRTHRPSSTRCSRAARPPRRC